MDRDGVDPAPPRRRRRALLDAATRQALSALKPGTRKLVVHVHVDVDVMDSFDLAAADVPQHNAGLSFDEAMASLRVFVASPRFAGLVVTEFNPDRGDEEGSVASRLARGIAEAF